MIVDVITEQRFSATPDGTVWTSAQSPYTFWERYLEVFEGVQVIARVCPVDEVPRTYVKASGHRVTFAPIPHYQGAWQFARRGFKVRKAVCNAVGHDHAVILRVASTLANMVYPRLRREGKPYAVEVVGDPWDVFAPGVVQHPLRPMLRWWFTRNLRMQSADACAASYVTQQALQRRYPANARAIRASYTSSRGIRDRMIGISDVEILNTCAEPGHAGGTLPPTRLLLVGSLEQLYKAPDTTISAVAKCLSEGCDLQLVIVGGGKFQSRLEEQARTLGIEDRVTFRGQLNSEQVREELKEAHLFVLASRTEGLPRAMIEAMAEGLPCIGSTVGGIPELLAPEDLVPPGDVEALAAKIREVAADAPRRYRMSERNLEKSREFHESVLRERRLIFYRGIYEETASWLANRYRAAS